MKEIKNNDQWYQHEGLTKVSMILTILENELGYPESKGEDTFKSQVCHPSIWNEESNALIESCCR